jgi:hypothetical protein
VSGYQTIVAILFLPFDNPTGYQILVWIAKLDHFITKYQE